jgi:hypothetical protein
MAVCGIYSLVFVAISFTLFRKPDVSVYNWKQLHYFEKD